MTRVGVADSSATCSSTIRKPASVNTVRAQRLGGGGVVPVRSAGGASTSGKARRADASGRSNAAERARSSCGQRPAADSGRAGGAGCGSLAGISAPARGARPRRAHPAGESAEQHDPGADRQRQARRDRPADWPANSRGQPRARRAGRTSGSTGAASAAAHRAGSGWRHRRGQQGSELGTAVGCLRRGSGRPSRPRPTAIRAGNSSIRSRRSHVVVGLDRRPEHSHHPDARRASGGRHRRSARRHRTTGRA